MLEFKNEDYTPRLKGRVLNTEDFSGKEEYKSISKSEMYRLAGELIIGEE